MLQSAIACLVLGSTAAKSSNIVYLNIPGSWRGGEFFYVGFIIFYLSDNNNPLINKQTNISKLCVFLYKWSSHLTFLVTKCKSHTMGGSWNLMAVSENYRMVQNLLQSSYWAIFWENTKFSRNLWTLSWYKKIMNARMTNWEIRIIDLKLN